MALGEFELIRRYFKRRSQRAEVLLGIGDDAAVLAIPPDKRLVVTVDTIVAGIHFPEDTPASDIGHRALAVNLSDLAAMGAQPAWITLSLSLPTAEPRWIEDFAAGLFALATTHQVELIGGDTVRGPLSITVQAMGLVETDRWLTRSGAKPGDGIYVSGVPGEAAAGLHVIQHKFADTAASRALRDRFAYPTPRVSLGRQLRMIASAAMDVSDGLLTDLDKLCEASACGAHVQLDLLPESTSMRALFDAAQCEKFSLAGGDDYELLFTIPPEKEKELHASVSEAAVTRIGSVVDDREVLCYRNAEPVNVTLRGYDHFLVRS
jgi:thiamine-monophosphate kinase